MDQLLAALGLELERDDLSKEYIERLRRLKRGLEGQTKIDFGIIQALQLELDMLKQGQFPDSKKMKQIIEVERRFYGDHYNSLDWTWLEKLIFNIQDELRDWSRKWKEGGFWDLE